MAGIPHKNQINMEIWGQTTKTWGQTTKIWGQTTKTTEAKNAILG